MSRMAAMKNAAILPTLNAGAALMDLIPPMPFPMPFPAPIPIPVGVGGGGGESSQPVSITIDVGGITIGQSSASDPASLAMEMLEQLLPHLDRAVTDMLRNKVEKTR